MGTYKNIILDIVDGVATITFNRPRVKNSLDVETLLTKLLRMIG